MGMRVNGLHYLALKGGGRFAQRTGWGSLLAENLDPLPNASRSTSTFQGEVKASMREEGAAASSVFAVAVHLAGARR
jgi:hypothetical protein